MDFLTKALEDAETELQDAVMAMQIGNMGRARVSARRGVGAFIQGIAGLVQDDPGTHAMANLRWVESHLGLPNEIRAAAARLLGGARVIAEGGVVSDDPVKDARTILDGLQHILSLA